MSTWQKVSPTDAEAVSESAAGASCEGTSQVHGGDLDSHHHQGSRRRAQAEEALKAVESWIAEIRLAPQGGVRESVEKQVGFLLACQLLRCCCCLLLLRRLLVLLLPAASLLAFVCAMQLAIARARSPPLKGRGSGWYLRDVYFQERMLEGD